MNSDGENGGKSLPHTRCVINQGNLGYHAAKWSSFGLPGGATVAYNAACYFQSSACGEHAVIRVLWKDLGTRVQVNAHIFSSSVPCDTAQKSTVHWDEWSQHKQSTHHRAPLSNLLPSRPVRSLPQHAILAGQRGRRNAEKLNTVESTVTKSDSL